MIAESDVNWKIKLIWLQTYEESVLRWVYNALVSCLNISNVSLTWN
jgi:hypothetical protein